jgi:coenzyme F420-reducing hydrogenase beta subunit
MQEDKYGELHPLVDDERCVQCNACIKSCPSNNEIVAKWPQKCFASWIVNKEKRCICASGGIGTILAEYVIRYKRGIVFGTAYDKDFTPRITYAESLEGIEAFKGSKYVQSIVGEDTYKKVKSFLKDDRFVLFIGTPCQIAGLKTFLKHNYENLITIDLICHGVSPTRYFKEEVSHLVAKYNIKNLCDIRFRGNDDNNQPYSLWDSVKGKKSNNFALTMWRQEGKATMRCYRAPAYTDYYLGGFLLGVTLRENCYSCKYATPERISDITIGDFIGLGKHVDFPYATNNVSSVTLNTDKALLFYQELSKVMQELMNIERDYAERLEYKPSLVEPFAKHPLAIPFREEYLKGGYMYASRKVLNPIVCKSIMKEKIHYLKNILILPYRVVRKLYIIAKE